MDTKIIQRRAFNPQYSLIDRVYQGRNQPVVDLKLAKLPSYEGLQDIHLAASIIGEAIRKGERIAIIGDYDVDGATSTTLLLSALQNFGHHNHFYLIPNRISQGYGLSKPLVSMANNRNADLIITVDNGISAFEGIEYANQLNIPVIVTDHHLPGSQLPPATAIINPAIPGQSFPTPNLAGVGVAFYLVAALRAFLNKRQDTEIIPLLDLVALGTIADMVKLDWVNRILVSGGLKIIRFGQPRPGIKALYAISNRNPQQAKAQDLGFALGPRLNAAGRLEDMNIGIECLLAKSDGSALAYAEQLDQTNLNRRKIQEQMLSDAMKTITISSTQKISEAICLFNPNWHEGVVGLVAGQIKEQFHRPTFAFAPAQNGLLKGSARSIPGIHIRDLLAELVTREPNIVTSFGGHAMAAGLSIFSHELDHFEKTIQKIVAERSDKHLFLPIVFTDGELSPHEISLSSALEIELHEPWGQGFPEPIFDGLFIPIKVEIIKKKHLRLTLLDQRSQQTHEGIWFNYEQTGVQHPNELLDHQARFTYRLSVNRFQKIGGLQLIIEHYNLQLREEDSSPEASPP